MPVLKTKATITMGATKGKPVIRLFISQFNKNKFLLQKGKQPSSLFTVIIV